LRRSLRERTIVANRLRHHLLEWGDRGPKVLLLHGFLEHAHAWELVAPRLAEAGHHVLALDLRGHGDSEWVGAGGYYHFADYVADLAFLVRALGDTVSIVGHSMGGAVSVLYAGTEPERVRALALIEGIGPPGSRFADAPGRFTAWISDLEKAARRPRRREPSLEAARQRLRERYPSVPEEAIRLMADHGTCEDGAERVWKFDPLHQTGTPQPFYEEQARTFWQRVTCPVLYVEGTESFFRMPPDETQSRLEALRARRVVIPGAAHHPHLEKPEETAAALLAFL
jgi:pimeloyl-ACP methyl ester carboxylesterase